MKRGLVLIACGLITASLLSACGGGDSDAEILSQWAHDIEHNVSNERPPVDLHFDPVDPPFGSSTLEKLTAIGVAAGRRVESAGRELTADFSGTPEQKKHLTCFMTTKSIDGELPHNAEELAGDIAEYFGDEYLDQASYLHYVSLSKKFLDQLETMEEKGVLSVNTALATVCDA